MKSSPLAGSPVPSKKKKYEDYEISGAHDTLIRAEEVKQDPELMAHVLKHHKKKKKALTSLDELKQLRRDEVYKSKAPKDEKESEDA